MLDIEVTLVFLSLPMQSLASFKDGDVLAYSGQFDLDGTEFGAASVGTDDSVSERESVKAFT